MHCTFVALHHMNNAAEWYKNWFDSPYYHVLYQHRNYAEAMRFIHRLIDVLQPPKGSSFLDKACGRGRHAGILGRLGYAATGLDLSQNNIAWARRYRGRYATFNCHDMRNTFKPQTFDYVLSLFTSFGYFGDADNEKVLQAVWNDLKPNGTFVIDFFNMNYVLQHLKQTETTRVNDMSFAISRRFVADCLIKDIEVSHGPATHSFHEKVKAFTPEKLTKMLMRCGFTIAATYGNYRLQPFQTQLSPRLIVIANKQ